MNMMSAKEPWRILLDGQQRITTLYMLINGELPPYYSLEEIMNDTRGLHVNVAALELEYYSKIRMENDPLWVDITDIFQKKVKAQGVIKELRALGQELSEEDEDRVHESFSKILGILDRDFVEQTIPINAGIHDAIEIFYKVNAGGVALTDAELALAQISGYWPQAREHFKKKLETLGGSGFVLKLDFVVFALLGILHQNGSDMRKLHKADNDVPMRQAWDLLDGKVFDYVANLLRSACPC